MYTIAKKIYGFLYYTLWKKKIYQPILKRLTEYYVVSFPKAGRTWLGFFIGEYFAQKYDIERTLDFSKILKKHPAMPRITFTHGGARPESVEQIKRVQDDLSDNKIIFLTRDPRDIVVSYYHQLNERRPHLGQEDFPDVREMSISEFIRHDLYGIKWIVEYMNLWITAREQFKDFLLIRYEDMQEKPHTAFRELLRFVGVENIEDEAFEKALENSSFDNMRKVEESEDMNDARLQPVDKENPDSYKVRKGKVGGFTEELSEEDIAYVNEVVKELHPDLQYQNLI